MTTSTSFTTTEEFANQPGEDFGGQYPVAFGIEFTPKVSGIMAGVAGFLLAGYLVYSQVLPILGELGTLNTKKQESEAQLNSLQNEKVESKLIQKRSELEEAKQVKQEVTNLFANPAQLDTLLMDLNKSVKFTNLTLNSYAPGGDPEVVADESFGAQAKDKIKRKSFQLDVEGTFSQIQYLLQDIERLQPLLVVSNVNATITEKQKYLLEKGQIVPFQEPKLKTTITVNAIIPVPDDELPQPEPPPEGQPPEGQPPAEQPK
jgi:hypothetical protein